MNNESIVERISDSRIDPPEVKAVCKQCETVIYLEDAIFDENRENFFCDKDCLNDWGSDNFDVVMDSYYFNYCEN